MYVDVLDDHVDLLRANKFDNGIVYFLYIYNLKLKILIK